MSRERERERDGNTGVRDDVCVTGEEKVIKSVKMCVCGRKIWFLFNTTKYMSGLVMCCLF